MQNRSKGRPPTRPIQLRDGFYIEIRNRGSSDKGVKVRCASKEIMDTTISHYLRMNKSVTILGEHKDFKWENEQALIPKLRKPKKQLNMVGS